MSAPIRAFSLKPLALLTIGSSIYVYAVSQLDNRDRTRLFVMPSNASRFTLVANSVIRKSVEGLQVVGAVHHKPKLDGAIVLLLARDGGLQSEELYVGEPKPDDMGCPGPAVDAG